MYLSLSSLLAAIGEQARPLPHAALAEFWALFGACLLATAVVILSSFALLRRTALDSRKNEAALSRFKVVAEGAARSRYDRYEVGADRVREQGCRTIHGLHSERAGRDERHRRGLPWYMNRSARENNAENGAFRRFFFDRCGMQEERRRSVHHRGACRAFQERQRLRNEDDIDRPRHLKRKRPARPAELS